MDPTKLLDDEPGIEPVSRLQAADEVSAPTHGEISELAYSYWEARGRNGGSPWDDWFRAERELRQAESEPDQE
ncbi:MAG TPA: DUF2934 domain-containing protein [Bryobacteraceae bacterium]|jgi:hypothetical protein